MGGCFGAPTSEGALANLIGECHAALEAPAQSIKEQVEGAPVAHFDESGSRVEKALWWLHAASTATATYYDIHPKRGSEALEAIGILPAFLGRAIHDFWTPYFGYPCDHGPCSARHLRELAFVQEQRQQVWAGAMIGLLLETKSEVDRTRPSADFLNQEQLHFCRIRSHISTARKNAACAMDALTPAFSGSPFAPGTITS